MEIINSPLSLNVPDSVIIKSGGAERLLETGYLQFPIGPAFLRRHVPIIQEGLRAIIDGPDLASFYRDILGADEVGWMQDSGLYRRDVREQKWFFHLFKETYERYASNGVPVAKYRTFFDSVTALNNEAQALAIRIGRLLDEHYAQSGEQYRSISEAFRRGHSLTRLLRYLERPTDTPDAHTHIDRSGLTVHWWASRQGLVVINRDGERIRVLETEFDSICVFLGKKLAGITEFNHGLGTLHGVADPARDAGAEDDRFAYVSFVHPNLNLKEAQAIREKEQDFDRIEKRNAL